MSISSNIKIRDASRDELGIVEELVMEACKEFRHSVPDDVWEKWMESCHNTIRSEHGTIIVAEVNENIEGVIQFYPDANKIGYIKWRSNSSSMRILSVWPKSRGKGVGKMLVKECIERAKKLNSSAIYIFTGDFMNVARHIYEKLGFELIEHGDKGSFSNEDKPPLAYCLHLLK